jgi:phage terminase large subunit-like protein
VNPAAILNLELGRRAAERFRSYFPLCRPLCIPDSLDPRDHVGLCKALYVKHWQFMDGGAVYPERLFLAANRIGKTDAASYEMTAHLTGLYPPGWKGKRFSAPIKAWAAGDTMLSTRDILQVAMLGPLATYDSMEWAGMIPRHTVHHVTRKSGGVPKCIHEVWVVHHDAAGNRDGVSMLEFKSFDQGARLFQGTALEAIWLDEEVPQDIYTECLLRTMTTHGMLLVTFTPLQGLSPFVLDFLQTATMPDAAGTMRPAFGQMFEGDAGRMVPAAEAYAVGARLLVGATWDDAPHLSEDVKVRLLASIPAYQRDARAKGIPQLGSGAIYPFPETSIKVPDFELPRHWPRGFGFDCALSGTTAAVWGALDRETSTLYLYSVYKRAQAETAVHAEGFGARGKWIPGVGDAADVVDEDRTRYIDRYRRHGFNVELPDKAVESGIQDVYDRLSSSTLKVFASCEPWFAEFRIYQRDSRGRVLKQNDHLMDATRYLVRSGITRMKVQPIARPPRSIRTIDKGAGPGLGWMR